MGKFYPPGSKPKDFLKLYGERFTAVEGNTTFYSLPGADTVARWAATMPADFRFCPKLPRRFSHQGALVPHQAAAKAFADTLSPLGPRLGPIMAQLPPSYGPAMVADLEQFLTAWPREQWPLAVEVRHLAWFAPPHRDRLNQMLEALGVGRVLLDTRPIYETPGGDPQLGSERRKPKLPLQPVVTAPFTIVRYIGHPEAAANRPYLAEWGPRLKQCLGQGREVYFFAHCPQEVHSPAIARQVYHQLQKAGTVLPPLKWDEIVLGKNESTRQPQQLSLL